MKAYQLRVRISENNQEQLLQLLATRAKNETLSDLVREAIELYIGHQNEKTEHSDFAIGADTQCIVKRLAERLERTTTRVLEDCVEGIDTMVEQKRIPLVVLELELRQNYRAEKALKSDNRDPAIAFLGRKPIMPTPR